MKHEQLRRRHHAVLHAGTNALRPPAETHRQRRGRQSSQPVRHGVSAGTVYRYLGQQVACDDNAPGAAGLCSATGMATPGHPDPAAAGQPATDGVRLRREQRPHARPQLDPAIRRRQQQTAYVYGVSKAGSDLDSNDVLGAIDYPDPGNGLASASYRQDFLVDALGQVQATADADGNRTTYAYDGLGRQVSVTDPDKHVTTTAYDA